MPGPVGISRSETVSAIHIDFLREDPDLPDTPSSHYSIQMDYLSSDLLIGVRRAIFTLSASHADPTPSVPDILFSLGFSPLPKAPYAP